MNYDTPAHEQILDAVLRLCRERRSWRFSAQEVVRSLPHIKETTVRTHVVSRCCVNAPSHHAHGWDYFERVARGIYEVRSPYRRRRQRADALRAAEPRTAYAVPAETVRETVHAVVTRSAGRYVGECLEVAVVTQGTTLDELVANLRAAVVLHLEGGDAAALGVAANPRLSVTYELATG